MMETVIQKASLVGQVIEDLSYEALSPDRFKAELIGVEKSPQYKQDGFFVFSDLSSGDYTLRVFGERFQPLEYSVTIPPADLMIDSSGDDELFVIVKTINEAGKKITFDPVILKKEIRAGMPVLASGFSTQLAAALDIGNITEAKLDNVSGLIDGSIVRIIRDKSIRLKFDPYHRFSSELTQIVGKVVRADVPEIPLQGAQVRLTQVNGTDVVLNDVVGAKVATVDVSGITIILGAEKDIVTLTNQNGDYILYYNKEVFPEDITINAMLEATLTGYQAETETESISPGQRHKIDIQLTKT